MAVCKRDDGVISYSVKGRGEALIMLRGLGRSSRYWLGFDHILAKHFKVIAIDHRGLGKSTVPMKWNNNLEDLSEDCIKVLNKLQIEKCHVFGLSLGGMVAMTLAAQHPERVRSLIIAASSSCDYIGFRLYPMALKRILGASVSGQFQETLLKQLIPASLYDKSGATYLRAWEEIRKDEGFPLATVAKQLFAAGRFRINRRIDANVTPMLILYGSHDAFVPGYNSRRLHQIFPGSVLLEVQGSGHEISLGNEKKIRSIIVSFTSNPLGNSLD